MDQAAIAQYVRPVGADPAAVLLQALERVGSRTVGPSGTRQEYTSQCPAHPDTKASMRWRLTVDGRALIHCHAGCAGQAILEALGLEWYQLRPTRVEYDYYDRSGVYHYTVERVNTVTGAKEFKQFRRDPDGSRTAGKGSAPDLLWLEPLLFEWVEDQRARGAKGGELWLCEGEKDAEVCASVVPAGAFVTTAPGGADGWKAVLTRTVGAVCATGVVSRVVLVGDRDPSGIHRLGTLAEDLAGALGPDIAISVVMPAEGSGKDIAECIDRYPDKWAEHLVDASGASLELLSGSWATGGLCRIKVPGAKKWVIGLSVGGDSDRTKPALGCDLEVQGWDGDGWDVRVVPISGEARECRLERRDLADTRGFSHWLAVEARSARVGGYGVAIGDVVASLPAFLDWDARVRGAAKSTRTKYCTWVDADTGKPCHFATEHMVFLDEGGRPLLEAGGTGTGVRGPQVVPGARWGLQGSETAAAWALAQVLTYAEPQVVASVAGWIGSVILAPWLSRYLTIKPGLAVIALSGSGKTNGATRMLLELAGCDDYGSESGAAFRRRLAAGVSVVRWLDDSAEIEKDGFKELLRIATARSSYHLADPDAGASATVGVELVGCPVVSAEGVSWLKETAMHDRFVVVRPGKPQSRTSAMPGRAGRLQWDDALELSEEWGGKLTALAGWVTKGVSQGVGDVRRWGEAVGRVRSRGETPLVAVGLGVRAVAAWLERVRAEAGREWPGDGWGGLYENWDWLVAEADDALADLRAENERAAAEGGIDVPALVSQVLPALVTDDQVQLRMNGMSRIAQGVNPGTAETFRATVQAASRALGRDGAGVIPLLLIDTEDRVWLRVQGVAEWWRQYRHGQIDERLTGHDALIDALETVRDNPDWAQRAGSGGRVRSGYKMRLAGRGGSVVIWHRLSVRHSRVVLGERE